MFKTYAASFLLGGMLATGMSVNAQVSPGAISSASAGFVRRSSTDVVLQQAGSAAIDFSGGNIVLASNGCYKIASSGIVAPDVFICRTGAKTLQIDADGASGALTSTVLRSPLTISSDLTLSNSGSLVQWTSGSKIANISDGVVQVRNSAGTSFTRLILGTNDATVNGLSLVLNGGDLRLRTGDDSAYINLLFGTATATGNLAFTSASGAVTQYRGISTQGIGLPAIFCESMSTTQTANFTACDYATPGSAGRYQVSAVITTTSSTNTGTVQVTVDYTDSQGTVHTGDILPLVDAAGTTATTKTGASKEFHTLPWKLSINNAAAHVILKVVITGTVSYTVSPLIQQVA